MVVHQKHTYRFYLSPALLPRICWSIKPTSPALSNILLEQGWSVYVYLFVYSKKNGTQNVKLSTTKYFRGQRLKKLVWNSTVIHEKTIDLVVLESVVWSKFVPTPTQPRLIRTLCISLKQHQHLFKIMIRSA